jgi:minor extracellular protease Epr
MKSRIDKVAVVLVILCIGYSWIAQYAQKYEPFPWLEAGVSAQDPYQGGGVKIAVIDVFPLEKHTALTLKPVESWSRLRNIPDFRLKDDYVDHGTHVAGIIHRLAPAAELHMISITVDPYDFRLFVGQGVDVINASAFMSGEWILRELVEALEKGALLVMAAGNEGVNLSYGGNMIRNILLRLEALQPELLDQIVLATNLSRYELSDDSWRLRKFLSFTEGRRDIFRLHSSSNVPGPFYSHIAIAAPGVKVESDLADGTQGLMTGTSMASPVVAGVIGRLMGAYNEMLGSAIISDQQKKVRAKIVRQALFEGAKKVQSSGSFLRQDQFGQGVVDYDKSLEVLKKLLAIYNGKTMPPSSF